MHIANAALSLFCVPPPPGGRVLDGAKTENPKPFTFFLLFWCFFGFFLGAFVSLYSDVGYLFASLLVCLFVCFVSTKLARGF